MSNQTATMGARRQGRVLTLWTPEDKAFWEREGQAVAKINLWISVPSLFLAFAIWQMWSVVAVSLPQILPRQRNNPRKPRHGVALHRPSNNRQRLPLAARE